MQNHFAVIRYGLTGTIRPVVMGGPARHLIPADIFQETMQEVIVIDSQNHPEWIVEP